MPRTIKMIACRALSHILAPLVGEQVQRVILPISLHLSRENLHNALMAEIREIEDEGCDIILGYGLCGRGVEGVYSEKSRLILPRVDDCVGALLGSRQRHRAVIAEKAGCFFLESSWLGSEVDIFSQCLKGLDRIPEEYRAEIMNMALKHYSRLALIDHELDLSSITSAKECRTLAEEHDLEFVRLQANLTMLRDLAAGNWSEENFLVVEPGQKIPYF